MTSPNVYTTTIDTGKAINCPLFEPRGDPARECHACRMFGICEAARERFGDDKK